MIVTKYICSHHFFVRIEIEDFVLANFPDFSLQGRKGMIIAESCFQTLLNIKQHLHVA